METPENEVDKVIFNQMTDEEKRRLLIAMYFLYKGSHHLFRLHSEFMERESEEEWKEALEKKLNLDSAIAGIYEFHLDSEFETENEEIQKLEDEVFEWIEDNGFTEGVKKYFDKNSLMFS
ncbi:MAG: hypothetical protein ACQEXQ_29110 [Bacillota bacterium]